MHFAAVKLGQKFAVAAGSSAGFCVSRSLYRRRPLLLADLVRTLGSLWQAMGPCRIFTEAPANKNREAYQLLAEFADRNGATIEYLKRSHVRKEWTGNGQAGELQMIEWTAGRKIEVESVEEADALAMLHFALSEAGDARITQLVPPRLKASQADAALFIKRMKFWHRIQTLQRSGAPVKRTLWTPDPKPKK